MLVMRNFGYLGLHNVVNDKSSLARHRLVDFTGELQVRRRTADDPLEKRDKRRDSDNYRLKLPLWHPLYISEAVQHGGRFSDEAIFDDTDINAVDVSKLYAQELAPLPLMLSPASTLFAGPQVGMAPVRSNYEDIEPFYHTTFCNEIICHPRILHNCEQGHHYSIKAELREIEWNESLNAYLAHEPRPGINPCIRNPRRGPFLVHHAFSSCTAETGEHHFIDEFRIKLPLDLSPTDSNGKITALSLFFTVYRVKTQSKSKWKLGAKMLFGSSLVDSLRNSDNANSSGRAKVVACGFLPIAPQSCLLDDGTHDVRLAYKAKSPPLELLQQSNRSGSVMLVERELHGVGNLSMFNRDSITEDSGVRFDGRPFEYRHNDTESCAQTDDNSSCTEFQTYDDGLLRNEKVENNGAVKQEHASLSVSFPLNSQCLVTS
jgi:hypothetical protein